jgi:hypothetical protein
MGHDNLSTFKGTVMIIKNKYLTANRLQILELLEKSQLSYLDP